METFQLRGTAPTFEDRESIFLCTNLHHTTFDRADSLKAEPIDVMQFINSVYNTGAFVNPRLVMTCKVVRSLPT